MDPQGEHALCILRWWSYELFIIKEFRIGDRVEAETRNVNTLLKAGNYEEALQAASQLFEVCTEADFQASTAQSA